MYQLKNQAKALWEEAQLDYSQEQNYDPEFIRVIDTNFMQMIGSTRLLLQKRADRATGISKIVDATHLGSDKSFTNEFTHSGSGVAHMRPEEARKNDLDDHVFVIHQGGRHPCPHCTKTFMKKGAWCLM